MGRVGRIVGATAVVVLALLVAVPTVLADPAPTHSMTIDATAISTEGGQFTLNGPGQDAVGYDTATPQTITLQEGTYTVYVGSGQAMDCEVTVDANGDWEYSANSNPCSYLSGQFTTTLTISGFPITVDPSALSGGLVFDLSTGFFSTPKQVDLVPLDGSGYLLQDSSGEVSTCEFDVDDNGDVTYDPSDEGCLTGAGTTALDVDGEPIRIDATALSTNNISIPNITDNQDQPSDAVQTYNILPIGAGGGYVLSTDTGYDANLVIDVDPSDTASVDASAASWASASGNTVTVTGLPVTINATAIAPDSFVIDGGAPAQPYDAATVQHLRLAPADGQGAAGTYGYEYESGKLHFDWGLSDSGKISYPPTLGACVSGAGTSTLTISCVPGAAPHSTGTLSMDRTKVYSTDPVDCGGLTWDTTNVTTKWVIHRTLNDVVVGTGRTFYPPRSEDGQDLYCEQTATSGGPSVTVKSAGRTVYELPAQTADAEYIAVPSGALLCSSTPCWYNLGSEAPYPENGRWYATPSLQCASLEWSSSFAPLSVADLALAEPHSETITLERITAAGTVVIASHTFDTSQGTGNQMAYFGSQTFSPGDYYAEATYPSNPLIFDEADNWVPGQGDFWYHGDTRWMGAVYGLSPQDSGATLRCEITVQNGASSAPTTSSTYVDGKVSSSLSCTPDEEGTTQPTSWPQGYSTSCITTVATSTPGIPMKIAAKAPVAGAGPAPPVVVTNGATAISVACRLPGGCAGTATLRTAALSALVAASHKRKPKSILLGSARIRLRRGHRATIRIRLSVRGKRLLKASRRGLTATLSVSVHGRTHALEIVTLFSPRPRHRKRR
jgi:hypothetical protein